MDSILLHTKNLLNIPEDFDGFDPAILTGINTSIFILHQIGLAVPEGFVVTGEEETWSDLLGETILESIKTLIFLKTKMEFDPPGTSFSQSAANAQIEELISRIYMELDPPLEETEEV